MFKFLFPDFHFKSIHDVPLSFYKENNIKGVLFDIDNTLEPYSTRIPSERTVKLFADLIENGIKISVISNNHKERVSAFCAPLRVSYYYESGKPSAKNINNAIEEMGLDRSEVVIVGDQLFTDIWASSNAKIRGIFVDKINNSESFFIRLKRILEIPFTIRIKRKGYGRIK